MARLSSYSRADPLEVGAWSRTYEFHKLLAAQSQPLDVVARRSVGLHQLPWWVMLGWCVLTAALWAAGRALWRQRGARHGPKSSCAWARWHA